MALPDVTFQIIQGGLAGVAPGEDHVSAIVEQGIAAPTGFGGAKAKLVRSATEAESLGVTATGTYVGVHYQVSEFFRVQPEGELWIMFQVQLNSEVVELSGGKVRQVAIILDDIADVTSVAQAAATAAAAMHAPFYVVCGYLPDTYTNGSETDLASLQADDVCVVAFGDFDNNGAQVASDLGEDYTPAVGAVLGAISRTAVGNSYAWKRTGELSDGRELDRIALPNGDEATVSQITGLHTKRYVVGRKYFGSAGTYAVASPSATAATRDIKSTERARVMHKAKRLIYTALSNEINGRVEVDAETGKLATGSVAFYEQLANGALDVMLSNGEISGRSNFVDPDQDILSTPILKVRTQIVPIGIAESIEVEIGFSLELA